MSQLFFVFILSFFFVPCSYHVIGGKSMVRIFVPINFSEYSINALNYAITLGQKIPSEVTLVHCAVPLVDATETIGSQTVLSEADVLIDHSKAVIEEQLTKLIQSIDKRLSENQKRNLRIVTDLETGYPEDVLVELSKKEEPDVIVMGTKSKGETIKELLGSVTSDVVRNAKVPVLAVPAESSINIEEINNILFVTDFNTSDYRSLHKLVRLITPFETCIHAVHFTTSLPDKYDKMKLEEMRFYCDRTYRNHQINFECITSDSFIDSLDQVIADKQVSLIAMTRHKRNVISQIFHPSFSRKILFHTDIPLLVLHE